MKYFCDFFIKEIIVYKRNGKNKKYEEYDFLFNILIIFLDFIHFSINIIIWWLLFQTIKKREGRNESNRIQRNNNRNQINTYYRASYINNNIENQNNNNNIVHPIDQIENKKNINLRDNLRESISSNSDNTNKNINETKKEVIEVKIEIKKEIIKVN